VSRVVRFHRAVDLRKAAQAGGVAGACWYRAVAPVPPVRLERRGQSAGHGLSSRARALSRSVPLEPAGCTKLLSRLCQFRTVAGVSASLLGLAWSRPAMAAWNYIGVTSGASPPCCGRCCVLTASYAGARMSSFFRSPPSSGTRRCALPPGWFFRGTHSVSHVETYRGYTRYNALAARRRSSRA
jgi:hypothetical protein